MARHMKVRIWAVEQGWSGEKVVGLVPLVIPLPTAQSMGWA